MTKRIEKQDNCAVCGKYFSAVYPGNPELYAHICEECTALSIKDWFKNEQELRLAVLQVLYWLRLKNPLNGFTEPMILKCLGLEGIFDIGPPLTWLRENDYIRAGKTKFQITDAGTQYLLEQMPVLKRLSEI
jgi:hypothetical protein